MTMTSSDRQYELVLLGATGYTGRLTAEHIVTHLPTDLSWALAGRSAEKLSTLSSKLHSLSPNRARPGACLGRSIRSRRKRMLILC